MGEGSRMSRHRSTVRLVDISAVLGASSALADADAGWRARGYTLTSCRLWRCKDGTHTARLVWRNRHHVVETVTFVAQGLVVA